MSADAKADSSDIFISDMARHVPTLCITTQPQLMHAQFGCTSRASPTSQCSRLDRRGIVSVISGIILLKSDGGISAQLGNESLIMVGLAVGLEIGARLPGLDDRKPIVVGS